MKKNIILTLLCGFALLWCGLSESNPPPCPYNDSQTLSIPNYTNSSNAPTAFYNSNASSSCVDIARFPLSSCLTKNTYYSSSALASDPIGGRLFQAAFNPFDWSGQLLAYQTDPTTGILAQSSLWDAGKILTSGYPQANPQPNNGITINAYSFLHPDQSYIENALCLPLCKPLLLQGIPFANVNPNNPILILSDTQTNLTEVQGNYQLGTYPIAYLLGNKQCEYPNICPNGTITPPTFSFRQRTTLLGDLINSDPLFVGSENFNYSGLPESSASSYPTFVNNKSQVNASNSDPKTNMPRDRMVYVGGNDGRLHGFEAGTWNRDISNAFDSGHGTEMLSFVPGSIINYDLYLRDFDTLTTQNPPSNHRYLVDGSPKAGDAYFNTAWHTVLLGTTGASNSGGSTIAYSRTLDNGGSIFALDITNLSNPSFAASNVLWEFTNNPFLNPSLYSKKNKNALQNFNLWDADIGIALSQPSLVRLQNGTWAVIVGNGYNSTNGLPVLYILAISRTSDDNAWTLATIQDSNFLIAKFSPCISKTSINNATSPTQPLNKYCSSGYPNGLSTPIAVDVDNDQRVDYVYAGDLQGNLWKFDLNCGTATNRDYLSCQSSSTSTDWKVANGGNPLYVAYDTQGVRQPITAKPQVGSVGAAQANALYSSTQTNKPSVMVYFGTGSYLGLCDVASSSSLGVTCPQQQNFSQQQTFYALWDQNIGTASNDNSIAKRSNLLQQTILNPSSITQTDSNKTAATNVRVTSTASSNLPCYQTSCAGQTTGTTQSQQLGWYMDLSTPSNMPSERSVNFPLLLNGNIVFTTQMPSSDPCNIQPSGWVMELNAITGNAPTNPVFLNMFGTNSSGKAPNNDLVAVQIGNNTTTMAPSGIQSTVGILKTPALIYGQGVVHKYFGGSTGPTGPTIGIQTVNDPSSTQGRVSWRQLR